MLDISKLWLHSYLKFYNNLHIKGSEKNLVNIIGNNKGTIILSNLNHKKNNLIVSF